MENGLSTATRWVDRLQINAVESIELRSVVIATKKGVVHLQVGVGQGCAAVRPGPKIQTSVQRSLLKSLLYCTYVLVRILKYAIANSRISNERGLP